MAQGPGSNCCALLCTAVIDDNAQQPPHLRSTRCPLHHPPSSPFPTPLAGKSISFTPSRTPSRATSESVNFWNSLVLSAETLQLALLPLQNGAKVTWHPSWHSALPRMWRSSQSPPPCCQPGERAQSSPLVGLQGISLPHGLVFTAMNTMVWMSVCLLHVSKVAV